VPSIVEAGFPDLVAENYFGVSATPGTPKKSPTKLYKALAEGWQIPATRKKLERHRSDPQDPDPGRVRRLCRKAGQGLDPGGEGSGAKL